MVQVGTDQGSGEVSGFAHGRETTGRTANMAYGEPTAMQELTAPLVFVPSRPPPRVSVSQHSALGESDPKGFSNLATLGSGVGFGSAPGQQTATYKTHETNHGKSNWKPASAVAKLLEPPTTIEFAGNHGKAPVPVIVPPCTPFYRSSANS